MSIQELSQKFKGFFMNTEYLLALLIVVVAGISFYLGRMSVGESAPAPVISANTAAVFEAKTAESNGISAVASTSTPEVAGATSGKYVASKSGTKYHLPWCPGAKQMKEENKIWFNSKEDAEKAGYTPAANCKGI